MLTLIFCLLLIPFLTVVITLGVWYWLNKENTKALAIKELLLNIWNDASKLFKDLKGLITLVSEVAQPLLSPRAIDVESEDVKDESQTKFKKAQGTEIDRTNKVEVMKVLRQSVKEHEVNNEEERLGATDESMNWESADGPLEDVMDEIDVFTELIQKEENIIRLEAVMQEWKAKGNDRLAQACAVAIEELKVKQNSKQELLNLWTEEELLMEEDIAS